MKVRRQWTTIPRILLMVGFGAWGYSYFFDGMFFAKYKEIRMGYQWSDPNYQEYKQQQNFQWRKFLQRWGVGAGGVGTSSMFASHSVLDKYLYGPQKLQQPPAYEYVCDEFIKCAEKSGLDPAKPLYETIKKMVDYYYPADLDPNPEETKQVLKPKIQWVHQTDLDKYVEDEEKKARPNTLSRYLWHVPGWQQFYEETKKKNMEEEETTLLSLNGLERQKYYENKIRKRQRLGLELNDYLPLLAFRWDRKLLLAKYIMNPANEEEIDRLSELPGGVKQIFINAGVISREMEPLDLSQPGFRA